MLAALVRPAVYYYYYFDALIYFFLETVATNSGQFRGGLVGLAWGWRVRELPNLKPHDSQ